MSTTIQEFDDLTKITGIGNSIQNRLRNSLQVQSYTDLAACSVDTIEADLTAEKSIPVPLKTRKKIEQWLDQAKELAKSPEPHTTKKDVWEPIDSFVLEFQSLRKSEGECDFRIAVQHVEHDANRHWDFRKQEEREALFEWMKNEANLEQILKAKTVNEAKLVETAPEVMEESINFSWETDVKPTQISLIQGREVVTTEIIDLGKRPFLAHIRHELPLDLNVTFALPAALTPKRDALRYKAQCQIHNLSQVKEPMTLEMATAKHTGDQPTISATLSDVTLEPGIYEWGILVRGERPLGANYYKFPKLNVL